MTFQPIYRDTDYTLTPSVQDWSQKAHESRYFFVAEGLDLSVLEQMSAGRSCDAYYPATLLSLLIYDVAFGTPSIRKIERTTYYSLAFQHTVFKRRLDHDTLARLWTHLGTTSLDWH